MEANGSKWLAQPAVQYQVGQAIMDIMDYNFTAKQLVERPVDEKLWVSALLSSKTPSEQVPYRVFRTDLGNTS